MASANKRVAVGIDLGTTTCCVAVWMDGELRIVPSARGNRTTPSCVAFTDGRRLFGEEARDQAAENPLNTLFCANLLLGKRFSDAVVQAEMKHWPFTVVCQEGDKPYFQVQHRGDTRTFSPEQVVAMLLAHLKEITEAYVGTTVTEVVLSCPSCFDSAQKLALKDAATIAGLRVLRLIPHSLASAVTFAAKDKEEGERDILVFDWGGGHLDVCLLTIQEGVVEVRAYANRLFMGGTHLDNKLVSYFVAEYQRQFHQDPTTDSLAMQKLRNACKRVKRDLSTSLQASLNIPSFIDGRAFNASITRTAFEDLCSDCFNQCLDPLDRVFRDSKRPKTDVREVFMVGGSAALPKIQSLVRQYFNKPVNLSLNPSESVATGLAIQAAILTRHREFEEILILDATGLSLGRDAAGNIKCLIPRNSTLPCKKSELAVLWTDQTNLRLEIYEGERAVTSENLLLDTFEVVGEKGEQQIEISFNLDANSVLTVTAQDMCQQKLQKFSVTMAKLRLSDQQLEQFIQDANDLAQEDLLPAKSSLPKFPPPSIPLERPPVLQVPDMPPPPLPSSPCPFSASPSPLPQAGSVTQTIDQLLQGHRPLPGGLEATLGILPVPNLPTIIQEFHDIWPAIFNRPEVQQMVSFFRLTVDEVKAIVVYTMEGVFRQLNLVLHEAFCNKDLSRFGQWQGFVFFLSSALQKLPDFDSESLGPVYRGIVVDVGMAKQYSKRGTEVNWSGFTSTSRVPKAAYDFVRGQLAPGKEAVVFEIHLKYGKDIACFSTYPAEQEVLLPYNDALITLNSAPARVIPGYGLQVYWSELIEKENKTVRW